MKLSEAIQSLSALAQETRLGIFRALVQAGADGLPAGRIAEAVGAPSSTLSFHLKELAHAGMVDSQQAGRFVIYTANFATMNALLGFLTENCCGGNPCSPVCTPACSTEKEST